jgi:DegV family protein with EDD domain
VSVRIVSDTACDLPPELVDDLGILLVPLHIRFGTTELLDRQELSVKDFWSRCAASEELPETAAPSPGAFTQAFETMAAQGAEGIVCITLSSKLSATHEAAAQAARAFEQGIPVEVVDSYSVTLGEGLVVLAAAEVAAAGGAIGEAVAAATSARDRLSVFGAIDTLENLRKGGRIGGAAAALGTVLSIKPVIQVRDGVVEQESRQRTRAKSLKYLVDKVRSVGPLERLAVMNADATDFAGFLELVQDVRSTHPRLVGDIGPVIGTHAGPGAIGLAWVREPA